MHEIATGRLKAAPIIRDLPPMRERRRDPRIDLIRVVLGVPEKSAMNIS
jgi:hypothetical protein